MSAAVIVPGPAAAAAANESPLRLSWRRFARNRFAMAAAGVVLLFLLMAIFAPWIAPQDPNETDLLRRLQPPVWMDGGGAAREFPTARAVRAPLAPMRALP